jgi:hypothetical protein
VRVSGWLLTFGLPDASTVPGGDAFDEGSVTVCSSGCVDRTQPAAQTLYNTLHVGEEVQVVS